MLNTVKKHIVKTKNNFVNYYKMDRERRALGCTWHEYEMILFFREICNPVEIRIDPNN